MFEKVIEQDNPMEEQHKMDEDDSDDLSLEISVFDSPKNTKSKLSNSKKTTSNKKLEVTNSAKSRKPRAKKTILPEESKELEEPNMEHTSKEKKSAKQSTTSGNNKRERAPKDSKAGKESKAKKRSSSKLLEEKIICDADSANGVFDANDSSSSDVFLNPESGLLEMKECSEPEVVEQDTKTKKRTTKRI